MKLVFVFLHLASCLVAQSQSDEDRATAIVERLSGPSKTPNMPKQFVAEKRLVVSRKEMPLEVGIEDAEEDLAAVPLRGVVLDPESFDNWIFGNMSGKDMPPAWLESVLKKRLVLYGTRYRLTESELAKLQIAGKGDSKRLFDEIDAKRKDFAAVRTQYAKASKVLTSTNPLANRFMNGPFEAGSLFSKTLAKILDDRRDEPIR
jgi:hypothetical protein